MGVGAEGCNAVDTGVNIDFIIHTHSQLAHPYSTLFVFEKDRLMKIWQKPDMTISQHEDCHRLNAKV